MVNFCIVLNFVYFVVAIFDLMQCTIWSLFFTFLNYEQQVEIFSEIRVIPGKVAQLSLIYISKKSSRCWDQLSYSMYGPYIVQ